MMISEMNEKLAIPWLPTDSNSSQLFKRFADPAEIAELIGFLLSDNSKFITGAAIPVEGGWTA
jgi:NAD(P)-dependent dehydrogenase (short-subunit alcohol dehydrogenase family)